MTAALLVEHAREMVGLGGDWDFYKLECLGNPGQTIGYQITGAIAPLVTRGKRKGRRNWEAKDKATIRSVCIAKTDHEQWLDQWEHRTGKCANCDGSGQTLASCSVIDGTTYRPCSKCGGTGLAARKEPA
jgi:hypothetical protein